jgi:hypothetical protein
MSPAIYLTGSTTEVVSFTEQPPEPDWRVFAMSRLQRHGINVINPLDLIWSEADVSDKMEQGVKKALDLIDQSDAVLANLTKPNYGTAMEIFYAHRQGKLVTVFGNASFGPWVQLHSKARFTSIEPALEYLIGEKTHIDPVPWSLQYEHTLSNRYEQFPRAGEADYQLLGGDLPVLVVAPHATASFREGQFQEPDTFTGAAAALLNRVTRNHSLISFYCCAADPYWHLETPFRKAFANIVQAGKVGLVIFLLGSTWRDSPGIQLRAYGPEFSQFDDYGCALRYRLSALEPITENLVEHHTSPLLKFSAGDMKVCTIELVLPKRYRMPSLQPQLFCRMIDLLNDFIYEVGADLLRSYR